LSALGQQTGDDAEEPASLLVTVHPGGRDARNADRFARSRRMDRHYELG
jgi:hypothetical protein